MLSPDYDISMIYGLVFCCIAVVDDAFRNSCDPNFAKLLVGPFGPDQQLV